LARRGCSLSVPQIRRILRDPIYVTGEWSTRYGGLERAGRPIRLADPIPPEIFEFNQQLLGLRRGPNRRSPIGAFCFNSVPFFHTRCRHLERDGARPILRGQIQGDLATADYRHVPWTPHECHGFRLEQGLVEPPVMSRLVEVAGSAQLLSRWASATRYDPTLDSPLLDDAGLSSLRARIRTLERQKARLERWLMDRLAAGEELDERDHRELMHAVGRELDQLRARLDAGLRAPVHLTNGALERARTQAGLRRAIADLLLDPAVAKDDTLRVRRAAFIRALLTEIEVDGESGGIRISMSTRLTIPA
jgi:hypothetical protein